MSAWGVFSEPEQPSAPFRLHDSELSDCQAVLTNRPRRTRRQLVSLRSVFCQLGSAWQWVEEKRTAHASARRLRVTETISLGDKRFLSILQVDSAQFLIGGSATNIQLLATLDSQHTTSFSLRTDQETS